jgi:hypothetical protein
MVAPVVKSIDMDRVNELLKVTDPYLKNYVRALRDVSSGWESLFHDSMKKIRELAAQCGTQAATVAAGEPSAVQQLRAEIIADIKEVVGSWFKCNDDLTHRECDILNSIAKCYKKR